MKPHDAIYHYGVKGMKWDKKKTEIEIELANGHTQTLDENGELSESWVMPGVSLATIEKLNSAQPGWQDRYKLDYETGGLARKSALEMTADRVSKGVRNFSSMINKMKKSFGKNKSKKGRLSHPGMK